MRILVTNDDGIQAGGLSVLEEVARSLSDDVWVVAPETDQSGVAHSLTLHDPLRVRDLGERRYSVRGTPTDCVIMGVREILPGRPDLVLSGVNRGQNAADDVTYSGTIAGAMEGTLVGIRSIALSQGYNFSDEGRVVPYEVAETHAVDVLRKCLATDLPEGTLLNVNFPNCKPDEVKGVAVTTQGRIVHGVGVEERRDGRNFPYFWIRFARKEFDAVEGTDIAALRDDYISITPLKLNLTAHEAQDALRSAF